MHFIVQAILVLFLYSWLFIALGRVPSDAVASFGGVTSQIIGAVVCFVAGLAAGKVVFSRFAGKRLSGTTVTDRLVAVVAIGVAALAAHAVAPGLQWSIDTVYEKARAAHDERCARGQGPGGDRCDSAR